MLKLKVNDIEVEVEEGLTVLQACEKAGAEIPRFCYHEKLSIAGNCRMCLVEMEKSPKPIASCAMPAADGMVIKTNTPKIEKSRKGVMEFLLANHPLDCPVCDQGGECDLQDQSMFYGIDKSRFKENKRAVPEKNMGPLIKTQMTRCIHCTRCVRFATEIAGVPELGAIGRGEDMQITTYLEQSVQSELSGNVIDLCPVGALTSKPYVFEARPWELKKTQTIDVMDAVGSNIRVDTYDWEVKRVLPVINEDINEEWISDKVRFNYDGYYQQRIDTPYIKENQKLSISNWEESLKVLKDKLKTLKPLALIGEHVDLETGYAIKKFMSNYGKDNVECRTDNHAILESLDSYRFNTPLNDIENSDLIILLGTNPKIETPIINHKIFKAYNNDAKVFNIGENISLNYKTEYLGESLSNLNNENLIKALKKSTNPLIIIGSAFLNKIKNIKTLKSIFSYADKYKVITKEKNNLNFLNPYASRVGQLIIGNTTNNLCEPFSNLKKDNFELVLSFGSEHIANEQFNNCFKVYFGHHGDDGAMGSDIVLPTPLYTEKNGTFVNIEGRPQEAKKCHNPIGSAKEEWSILKKLSDELSFDFTPNTFDQLRSELFDKYPILSDYHEIIAVENSTSITPDIEFEDCKAEYPVSNFYMSDVISKNSVTMAKCVEEIISTPSLLEKSA